MYIYDSLAQEREYYKEIVAKLGSALGKTLKLMGNKRSFKSVPQQKDAYSCGLYACAFLKSLAKGGSIEKSINPEAMRREIMEALQQSWRKTCKEEAN